MPVEPLQPASRSSWSWLLEARFATLAARHSETITPLNGTTLAPETLAHSKAGGLRRH